MTFKWNTSVSTAAADSVTLTVTDPSLSQVSQTYTFWVPAATGSSTGGTTWNNTTLDPGLVQAGAPVFSSKNASVVEDSGGGGDVYQPHRLQPGHPRIGTELRLACGQCPADRGGRARRETAETWLSGGTAIAHETFAYDAHGELTSAINPNATVTISPQSTLSMQRGKERELTKRAATNQPSPAPTRLLPFPCFSDFFVDRIRVFPLP